MTRLGWIHDRCLGVEHDCDKSVFIFDPDLLKATGYSLKRIQFMYEAALDCGHDIYKGATVEVLKALVEVARVTALVTWDSPDPRVGAVVDELRAQGLQCIVKPHQQFFDAVPAGDYNRFFQYWKKAKKNLKALRRP